MKLRFLAVVVVVVVACSRALWATTIYVDDDAPNDPGPGNPAVSDPLEDGSAEHPFDAIQEGIDAAISGDTVLVKDGTYTGGGNRDIAILDKAITVRGKRGAACTIIDCEGSAEEAHRAFLIDGPHGTCPRIEGLTIRNGWAPLLDGSEGHGGAICSRNTDTTIASCVFRDNYAPRWGGAVYAGSCDPTIKDCFFEYNKAEEAGGGIACADARATIEDCILYSNLLSAQQGSGAGIAISASAEKASRIHNTLMVSNRNALNGGGVCVTGAPCEISNCTFSNNRAGTASHVYAQAGSVTTITNSILWSSSYPADGGTVGVAAVVYCDVSNGTSQPWFDPATCIDVYPEFARGPLHYYYLSRVDAGQAVNSPCVDAGSGTALNLGLDTLTTRTDGLPDTGTADMGFHVRLPRTILVDDDGPADPAPGDPSVSDPLEDGSQSHPFDAIQEAIEASLSADTVCLRPGLYMGNGNRDVDFLGKNILVMGQEGADATIIDCQAAHLDDHRGFVFQYGEGEGAVLRGVTIRHGYRTQQPGGGAIYCESSSPEIQSCVIKDNAVWFADGGGIFCRYSEAALTNCTFIGNNALFGSAGGLYAQYSDLTVLHCTFTANAAHPTAHSGGIRLTSSDASVSHTILWGNSPGQLFVSVGSARVSYCCIEGGWGEGETTNIDVDPQLLPDGRIELTSPCVDWCPSGPSTDRDGDARPQEILWRGYDGERLYDIGADEAVEVDEDMDGLPDWWELLYFGDLGHGPLGDDDVGGGDGLSNGTEYAIGTNPASRDTDADSREDGVEVAEGTNPRHPDNTEKTYYVNGDPLLATDSYDGLAPLYDGTHGPKLTVQAGIDASLTGWGYTVQVAAGTYTGDGNRDLDFDGKAITVRSESGPSNTIIDCEGTEAEPHRGFDFTSGETAASVLDGFTIRHGVSGQYGGGIRCDGGSPTITNCTITGNFAARSGGGIYCVSGSTTISNCTITDNAARDWDGGGIHISGTGAMVSHCIISGNSAVLGGGVSASGALVADCTITNNVAGVRGGGVAASHAAISGCCIAGNSATSDGGGICSTVSTVSNCTITANTASRGGGLCCRVGATTAQDCILWANSATFGHDMCVILAPPLQSVLTVRHCDVQGGVAEAYVETGCILDMDATCIDADPLFVSGPLHDYYLSQVAAGQAATSPCVDAGSDTAANLGLDGLTTRQDGGRDEGVVDMGYHAAPAPYVYAITRAGADITVWWNGVAGIEYVVEWSEDHFAWNEVAVGAVESWTDVGALTGTPTGAHRYCRVREDAASPAPGAAAETITNDETLRHDDGGAGRPRPTFPTRATMGPNVRSGGNVARREAAAHRKARDEAGNVGAD